MHEIQDTENMIALEPIRECDAVTNLQASEELQEVTRFLHATGRVPPEELGVCTGKWCQATRR
eukprot:5332128-Prorocentrum_lima.AAC.1